LKLILKKLSPAGALSVLLWAVLAACTEGAEDRLTWFTGTTMGTGYSVKITDLPPALSSEALAQDIAHLLAEINRSMSTYLPDSELSCFNRNPSTDWITVSPPLAEVVREAQEIGWLSGGAFDVTVGSLVNLWGFGPAGYRETVPPAPQIETIRERVGIEQLRVRQRPPALRKARADVYVDLSGIAKGYGVDQVAEFLERQGIDNYLVDIGGEGRSKGYSPRRTPWRVAIEQPLPGERKVQRIVALNAKAMATSGDYRNYFEWRGKRYSHTIDPRTGWSVTHRLVSVTVLSNTAMRADALATALMVLGPEVGFKWATQKYIPALMIVNTTTGLVEKATPEFIPSLYMGKH
jgi:FAD:protein FMN transferase